MHAPSEPTVLLSVSMLRSMVEVKLTGRYSTLIVVVDGQTDIQKDRRRV